ncbi:MAG: IS4 family transposase [Bryobacteraceae bacterium]
MSPVFDLYGQWVVSSGVLDRIQEQVGIRSRRGIYSLTVVLWLMIWQRLQPHGTMNHAVRQLVEGGGCTLLASCKRVQEGRISQAAGGYCQGIQKMPKLVPQLVTRDVVARLSEQLGNPWPGLGGPVYVVDGSTLLLPHTRKLAKVYPPGSNQHGSSHWPIMRIVVLHDVSNALALYPKWGPLNGDHAVSEQRLAAQAFDQLPKGATVIADRNFGVFSVAWGVAKQQCGVIVRLTKARAQKLFGGAISQEGDYPVQWQASRWDKPQGKPWPQGATLEGRLIAVRVGRGKSKMWLYLFTTQPSPAAEVVAIYGQRWNIETDLRSLKRTVQLQQLRSRSVDGMEKELLTAICAYNFVRAVMCLAARRSSIPARRLSFTQTLDIVNGAWPRLISSPTRQAHDAEFEKVLDWVAACKLPIRSKPRHYPREVWGRGYHFPTRKTK